MTWFEKILIFNLRLIFNLMLITFNRRGFIPSRGLRPFFPGLGKYFHHWMWWKLINGKKNWIFSFNSIDMGISFLFQVLIVPISHI